MQRIILFGGEYWQVVEYILSWELHKHAVSISYRKLFNAGIAETYSQFTDRLMKIHLDIENKHGK